MSGNLALLGLVIWLIVTVFAYAYFTNNEHDDESRPQLTPTKAFARERDGKMEIFITIANVGSPPAHNLETVFVMQDDDFGAAPTINSKKHAHPIYNGAPMDFWYPIKILELGPVGGGAFIAFALLYSDQNGTRFSDWFFLKWKGLERFGLGFHGDSLVSFMTLEEIPEFKRRLAAVESLRPLLQAHGKEAPRQLPAS